jgi:hypothetical protein
MSFLFGSSTSSTPTSSTVTQKLPAWLEAGGKETFDFAKTIAKQPYQAYQGPRIAPLSQGESMGIEMGKNVGTYAPAVGRAGELFDEAAGGLPGVDMASYMNPYEGQVVNQMIADLDQQRSRDRIAAGDAAAASGSFGGSRHGIREAEVDRGFYDTLGRESGNLRYRGWETGMGLASSDLDRKAGVGSDFMRMGALIPELQRGDIDTAVKTGQLERGYGQSHLDLAYRDFLEERGYPEHQLEIMRSGLGVPTSQTTTTNGQQITQDPSIFGQAAGAGLAAAGLFGGGGGTGFLNWLFN